MASYGISLIWNQLRAADFRSLDKAKATFQKRAFCLPTSASNTKTFLMAATPRLAKELRKRHGLPATPEYETYQTDFRRKMAEIEPDR